MNRHKSSIWSAARRLLVPALVAAGLAACKDVTSLDESAQTFISPDKFYRNDAQAQQAVNGAYAPLMGWNGWKSPAQYSVLCEDNEILCWNWMGGGFSGNQAGEWYMQDNSVYIGDYQLIERANEILDNIPGSSGVSDAEKKVATGQAYFIRGYAYFDLVRRYGAVPIRTSSYQPEAQLGAKAPSPVEDVWKQAVSDLSKAAPLLPVRYTTNNGQGLPRQATAWGLLAKVYLHMAGDEATGTSLVASRPVYLDSALATAKLAIADPSVALEPNYMDLFDINKQNTSPEILFAVQGAAVNLSGSQMPAFFGPQGDCTVIGGCGQGFASLREDFYRGFDAGDKRVEHNKAVAMSWENTHSSVGPKLTVLHVDSLAALYASGAVVADKQYRWESWTEQCGAFGTWFDSVTFHDAATNTNTVRVVGIGRPIYSLKYVDRQHLTADQAAANNFIILRLADVLLVAAEAENELHGPTAAYAYINQVRSRANLPALSGLSLAQFRQAVWTERSHELYGEFQARFDLIREGRWLQVMNANTTVADLKLSGNSVCRPRQSYQKLQNIPNKELAANPLMKQNLGY